MMRRVFLATIVALLAFVLSGCSSSTSPGKLPSETSTSIPKQTTSISTPTDVPTTAVTPTPSPTHTPTPTFTPSPTHTLSPTNTPTPTMTPTPISLRVRANTINARKGPGTDYPVVLRLRQGDTLTLRGQWNNCEWLYVTTSTGSHVWVYAQLIAGDYKCSYVKAIAPPSVPIPAPTPTPIPRPEDILSHELNKYLKDRLRAVYSDDKDVIVEFKVEDLLFMSITKFGLKQDIVKILYVVRKSRINYQYVTVIGYFPLKDVYGNIKEGMVVSATYTKDTVDKINFSHFDTDDIYVIAEDYYLHPDLR